MSSLPVLAKSWQFNVNNQIAANGSTLLCAQKMWRTLIAALLGFGSNALTCLGSSDSTTAALDATNRWTADSKIVSNTAGSVHSWIVLKMPGAGANVQICIDIANATNATQCSANVYVSVSAGFAGGTTTNRPTATDEFQCGTAIVNTAASNSQNVYHVLLSTDGSSLRIACYNTNALESYWHFEKPSTSSSNWSVPFVGGALTNPTTLTYATLFGSGWMSGRGPSGTMTLGCTTECYGTSALGQLMTVVDGIDGGFVFTPCGLYSATSGMTGQHGRMADFWLGSTTPNTGDTYPNDTTRQFVQINNSIHPWNGTVFVTA